MRPPITIVTFTAGTPRNTHGHTGEFRHVLGRSDIEVRSTDGLGDPIWVPCGQSSCPLTIEDLRMRVINTLISYIGQAQLDPDKRPPPISVPGTSAALTFTARGLEISLGRVA